MAKTSKTHPKKGPSAGRDRSSDKRTSPPEPARKATSTQRKATGSTPAPRSDARKIPRSAVETAQRSRPGPSAPSVAKRAREVRPVEREIGVETSAGFARSVADFAATYAAPLALVSAGVGGLLVSLSRRSAPDGATHGASLARYAGLARQASHALQAGGERVLDGAHALEERVAERAAATSSQLGDDVSRWSAEASKLGHEVVQRVGRAGRRAVEFGDKHPLATGLAILAAGTAAAALLPVTRRENEWLGVPRDRLVARVRRSAADVAHRALERTDELRDVFAEFAREAE